MSAHQTTSKAAQSVVWSPAAGGHWGRAEAFIRDALRFAGVVVADVVSRRPVRPLAGERVRTLPGDELVADPKLMWVLAITMDARPAEVWQWLVQMGTGRGGFSSYHWLDRWLGFLDRASATHIRPVLPADRARRSSWHSNGRRH